MPYPCASRPVSSLLRLTVVLLVLGLAACGDGRKTPKVYPVKGKVLVNGKPAMECQVILNRTTPADPATAATPQGLTDENGEFQLTSYTANDGAPEGEYIVTIEWRERSGLTKADFDGPDQLGATYAKVEKTKGMKGFVVKVERQALTLPPFELTQSAEAKRKLEEARKRRPSFGGPLGGDR